MPDGANHLLERHQLMLKSVLREIAETATRDIADPAQREQAIGAIVARHVPVDRATADRRAKLDLAYRACCEQHFISALADHTGASFEEAEQAFDGLSANLHGNVESRAGWALLAKALAVPGFPQLVATLH